MIPGTWKIVLGIFIRLRFSVSPTCTCMERIKNRKDLLPPSLRKRTDILTAPVGFASDMELTPSFAYWRPNQYSIIRLSAQPFFCPSSGCNTELYHFDTFLPQARGRGAVDV